MSGMKREDNLTKQRTPRVLGESKPTGMTLDLLTDLKKAAPDLNVALQVLEDIEQVQDPAQRAELRLRFMRFLYPERKATEFVGEVRALQMEIKPQDLMALMTQDAFRSAITVQEESGNGSAEIRTEKPDSQ